MPMLRIRLDGRPKKIEGRPPNSVLELLARLSLSPQEALVRVDGKIRPEGHPLTAKSKIEVIRVVFGG